MYTKPRNKPFKNNSVMSHQWATTDSPYIRQYTYKGYFVDRLISVKNMIYLYNLYYDYRYKKGKRLYLWDCLAVSIRRPYQTSDHKYVKKASKYIKPYKKHLFVKENSKQKLKIKVDLCIQSLSY